MSLQSFQKIVASREIIKMNLDFSIGVNFIMERKLQFSKTVTYTKNNIKIQIFIKWPMMCHTNPPVAPAIAMASRFLGQKIRFNLCDTKKKRKNNNTKKKKKKKKTP